MKIKVGWLLRLRFEKAESVDYLIDFNSKSNFYWMDYKKYCVA